MTIGYRQALAQAVLAIAVLVAAPLAAAQSVALGGTSLKLGASRAATLTKAKAYFRLSPAQRDGQYNLYPNGLPGANGSTYPPAIGSITFANGRLVRVTRNLGSFHCADGKTAIDNLISAFAQAPHTEHLPRVHTDTGLSGDASTARVYFSYADRVIQIVVYQPADPSKQATVDISEQYALPDDESGKPAQPG